jgi:sugar phosphate isomerase/epimerase
MGEPWVYHPDNRTEEARERVILTFRELCDCATAHGAHVGMEGAFGHVCYSPDVLSDVIQRIDRPNIKVIFDLYNYLDISNYTEAYGILDRGHELFGSDILLYHVKDFTVSDGKLKQCGVGRGILDFERILGEIYKFNKDAILVLEGTTGEDIPYAISTLRKIINKL